MSVKHVLLQPNRNLIETDFQGYKLSLDLDVPTYKSNVVSDIKEVKLHEDCYSLQHVKCYSLHNHLHTDPYNSDNVYYVTDDLHIFQVNTLIDKFGFEEPRNIFKIPTDVKVIFRSPDEEPTANYNVNLKFISEDLVVLSNGLGTLFILQTGNRKSQTIWKEIFSINEFGARRPFLLMDSTLTIGNDFQTVDSLLLRIEEKSQVTESCKANDDKSNFVSILEWITLTSDENGWQLKRLSRLQGSGSIDYAAIDSNDNSVWIASDKKFEFVFDSIQSVDTEPESKIAEQEDRKPVYAWQQTPSDITVWFKLQEKITKEDVDLKLTATHICLKLQNSTVLDGQFFAPIDVDGSTWIIGEDNKLELSLSKSSEGLMWQELVKNDSNGEEVIDPELLKEIHEKLAHLTSDTMNPDPKINKLGDFNLDQLEECDDFPEYSFGLTKFDRITLKPAIEVSLSSHNWLFDCPRQSNEELPRFCVRYDVDGLLCIPNKTQLDHLATFNALGYVSASKQDRKFLSCAPDTSYAVLCDQRKHVYLYFQPSPIESDLRNRKTGQKVKAVAKQRLITLDNCNVLGVSVSNKNVFVLTKENIHLIQIKQD